MPRYSVDDKVYNIPEDKEQAFLAKFPKAKLLSPLKQLEGNEDDVETVDPNDTSMNTGSDGEDTSSDSPEDETIYRGENIEEINIRPQIMTLETFIELASNTKGYKVEKGLSEGLNTYYSDDPKAAELTFENTNMLGLGTDGIFGKNQIKIKSGYLLSGSQKIFIPKQPYRHHTDEDGNVTAGGSNREDWIKAYNAYVRMTELHFEGANSAPETAEERENLRKRNDEYTKDIALHNINFQLKNALEVAETDEEKQRLQDELLFNEQNPEEVKNNIDLEALREKDIYELNKQRLDDWNNTVGQELANQYRVEYNRENDPREGGKNFEIERENYINQKLNEQRAAQNPIETEVIKNYQKAIDELQTNSGFNMVQNLMQGKIGSTTQRGEQEFNNLDWIGDNKFDIFRNLPYKDVKALANGDLGESWQRNFLAQEKQKLFSKNIDELNQQSDQLELAVDDFEQDKKDYDDLVADYQERSTALSEEYGSIGSQLESVQKLLEGDVEALNDFQKRIDSQTDDYLKGELQKLYDNRFEEYNQRYNEYKELRESAQPYLERARQLENEYLDLESQRQQLEVEGGELDSMVSKITNAEERLYAEFSYDESTKVINSGFKLDEDYYEWKNKRVTDDTGVFGSSRDFANTLVTGLIGGGLKFTAGTVLSATEWLGSKVEGIGVDAGFSTSENVYDKYDWINNKFNGLVAALTTFVPIADGTNLRKEGQFLGGYKHAMKTTANMLPFTIQIIVSARKGDVTKMGKLYSTLAKKGVDAKKLTALKGSETAWRLTIHDNVQEGKALGLDDEKAQQYGFYASVATSLSQLIMPDFKLVSGSSRVLSGLKSSFGTNLKAAVNRKAALNAVGQFWLNYTREYTEELTELTFQNINKHSLALGHGSIFGTLENHRDIAESVLLLNGTLQGTSTAMGSGDYQAFRNQLFDGFRQRGLDVVQDIENDMLQVAEKINIYSAAGNDSKVEYFTDLYNKMKKGRDFSLLINNAINLSPESVTDEQLDLVIQKQELLAKKKELDPAFAGMYDANIEALDVQINNSGVAQVTEKMFDRTTKNAKLMGEKMGIVVKVFGDKNTDPSAEIEAYLSENTNLPKDKIKQAAKEQGGAFTDNNGNEVFIVNKSKAMTSSGANVAAHELLHKFMAMTMAETTEDGFIITDQDGNPLLNKEAALAIQQGLGAEIMKLNPKRIADSTFSRRVEAYQSDPSSVQAVELLTLFGDALASGDIKYEENVFTKIRDFVRKATQKMGMPITFRTGKDVFNFLRDYNESIAKGEFSKAQKNMFRFGAELKGDISKLASDPRVKKEVLIENLLEQGISQYIVAPSERTKNTKVGNYLSSRDLNDLKDFDNFTQNPDGTPKYSTQEDFKMSEDYYNGYSSIVDSSALDGLIMAGMTEKGLRGAAMEDFVRKVKEEIGDRYLGKINKKTGERGRGFDIEATNASLFGWITGVAGGQGKSIIFRAKGDVMNQYKKDKSGGTVSLDKNIGDGATFGDMLVDEGNNMVESFEQENLSHTEAREQAVIPGVFASAFGLDMESISNAVVESNVTSTGLAYVDAKKAVSDVQKVKNKKGKLVVPTKSSDVVPTGPLFNIMEIVAAKFGVPASRVLANQTLNDKLRINAQNAIKENWKDLRDLALPEGETVSGQSTLVANTGLGVFYNKGERISMKQSGSAVGKEAQTKRTDITKEQFWAEFGINPDGSFMTGTKFDNNIRELIKQAAAITANQGVRMNDIKNGTAETAAVALFGDGRSSIAFSKDFRILPPEKQTLFVSEIPQISAMLNPSIRNVSDWKQVRDVLVSVFEGLIPKSSLGGIAKDIVKMAKYFKPVADSRLDLDGFDWGNYVANSFTTEADNITKLLGIEIDGEKIKGSDLYDNIDLVAAARKAPADIGKALLNTINPKTGVEYTLPEVARVMAILKPMYAGASKVGRGSIAIDKNGKPYYIEGADLSATQRYQVFNSTSDFMKWGVLQIPGMTQEIFDAANTKLLPQNSKYAVEKGNYEASLAEATEVREVINMALNVVGDNDTSLAMFMISANSSMKAPIRRAANLRYIADSVKNMNPKQLGSLAEYEHMIPANYMAIKIIQEHKKGGIKNINEFYKDYNVAVIPKTMDNVLKAQGLQSLMNAGYQFGVDPSWFRYYNSLTIPFAELETIRDISTGELIGEPYTRIEIDKKIENAKKYTKARNNILASRDIKPNGASVFDFDETLIIDGDNFIIATDPATGKETKISSGDWPVKGPGLAERGFTFDFADFVNVRGGVEGPLLNKLRNRIAKYGPKNNFILTARPAESATAIYEWLKTKGITIPFENITGLGNSTGKAKADWLVDKYSKGYNDIYFVDDAMSNVKAVREAFNSLDIKGSVVQAKINFSKDIDITFNKILENTKGVGAEKRFSRVEARRRGKNKGRFTFFVPPSAEDFAGLLRYFAGTGAQGDADIKFFEEALIKPFARADRAMSQQKQAIRDDYKALQKEFPSVKKILGKLTDGGKYTYDMAVRVYLFDKAGYDVPGLSNSARINMVNIVKQNQELRAYADALGKISRQEQGYLEPTENWDVENIAFDLQNATARIGRKQFLAEFLENKDIIFSPDNLNKIEAIYGSNFRSALEDILYRMETGQNRRKGATKFENAWNNWINNSVGAIMFFNARSAVLQTLSTVNFINFEDNNIFKAGKAFANQKQYWSDFSFLFNSDFLRNRRAGLATNVNEAELANAVAGATNKAKAALGYLLKIGFTPTQIADSFAIASGGASFYRNRVNKYLKQGMSQAEAEAQAFLDFQEIAEETQQSARPDKISQQQASNLGRIILAFANTPMQYNRLIKKAAGDLINGRGDWRSNVSRIVYYGAVQNFIFAAMQNALFALAFDDDEELTETQQAAKDRTEDTKHSRILNSMFDSLARGSGIYGAALATFKNAIIKYIEEDNKGWRADYAQVVIEALNVSPPLGSKARKLYSAGKTRKFSRDVMNEMSMLDYDNPGWQAVGNVVEATTNIPMARAIRKIDNLREAFNEDNTNMQRMMLFLGWSAWDLNVGTEVVKNEGKENEYVVTLDTKRMNQLKVEQELDAKKAKDRKEQAEKKKQEKKEQEVKENEQKVQENIEKQKKEGEDATCAAISSKGNRCKRKPVKDGFCTVHEKVEQNETGEKKQCAHIKPDGKRCKMKTNSKSGNCYYHD